MANAKKPAQFFEYASNHTTDANGDFAPDYTGTAGPGGDPIVMPPVNQLEAGSAPNDPVWYNKWNAIMAYLFNAVRWNNKAVEEHVHGNGGDLGAPKIRLLEGIDWSGGLLVGGVPHDGAEMEIDQNDASVHSISYNRIGSALTQFFADRLKAETFRVKAPGAFDIDITNDSPSANAKALRFGGNLDGVSTGASKVTLKNADDIGLHADFKAYFRPDQTLYTDNLTKMFTKLRILKPVGFNTFTVSKVSGSSYNCPEDPENTLNQFSVATNIWTLDVSHILGDLGNVSVNVVNKASDLREVLLFPNVSFSGGVISMNPIVDYDTGSARILDPIIDMYQPNTLVDFELHIQLR